MAERIKNDFVVFNGKFAVYANSRVEIYSVHAVGHDGGMHVTAGEYRREAVVLSEAGSESCL